MAFDRTIAKTMLDLSELAYSSDADAKAGAEALSFTEFRPFSGTSTQAFRAADANRVVLAFRGTEANPVDWIRDAQFVPRTGEFGAKVHSGFHLALNEVWAQIVPTIEGAGTLFITGHSLGAGLATLAAARVIEMGGTVAAVYTYGGPRTGLRDFRDAYDVSLADRTYRFINHIDLVTRVPLMVQGFAHGGSRMYFDAAGKFHENASSWKITSDDLKFRLRHFGRLKAAGLDPHFMPSYQRRVRTI